MSLLLNLDKYLPAGLFLLSLFYEVKKRMHPFPLWLCTQRLELIFLQQENTVKYVQSQQ